MSRRRYELTDLEWSIIAPLLRSKTPRSRASRMTMAELVCASLNFHF